MKNHVYGLILLKEHIYFENVHIIECNRFLSIICVMLERENIFMYNNLANTWRFSRFIEKTRPTARATVKGSPNYPEINGTISFFQTKQGVLVVSEVFGLPFKQGPCGNEIFAMHIHDGSSCTGNDEDPFAAAGTHYNPNGCDHPYHAGDLPPLFGNAGYAWSAVLTDRFSVEEIKNKTVIIHRNPDDFTTQPSGKAGEKIACGVIV